MANPDATTVLQIQYHDVHDCQASREQRPCEFGWRGHMSSTMCACGPTLDDTNVLVSGEVFLVHKGVC